MWSLVSGCSWLERLTYSGEIAFRARMLIMIRRVTPIALAALAAALGCDYSQPAPAPPTPPTVTQPAPVAAPRATTVQSPAVPPTSTAPQPGSVAPVAPRTT